MHPKITVRWVLSGAAGLAASVSALGDELTVVSLQPAARAINAPVATKIVVHFDRPVLPSSVTAGSFSAFGRWSGSGPGAYSFSDANQTVTLTPTRVFSAGESVMVVLSNALEAADGSPMRPAGYSYQFWTRTRRAAMNYATIDVMSNNSGEQTRIYGASASDLDGDGWLDLTTVNEVSSDLRVFMNKADGTGLFDDWLQPAYPISYEASPNEPADFNGDGIPDLCAAASGTGTVWVVLGNGDGTFGASQEIDVGSVPHGIAVLDADGDGDMDVATSNTGDDNVSLMLNNGNGSFGAATEFEGGGAGEYALSAADMDNDGIMDLVVGCISSEEVVVHHGNGDGTFTQTFSQDAGGNVWMLVCGDVNGDGNMDVATSNSFSASGSILLGNGAGAMSPPVTSPISGSAVATDLADLDGDGDMDWVLSSFGGGIWRVFKNNGAGAFTLHEEFDAVSNPSCCVLFDFDNDRDIDMALSDEIADLVTLEKNSGTTALADLNGDGSVDLADYDAFFDCFNGLATTPPAGCSLPAFGDADISGDGDVDLRDYGLYAAAFTAP